MAVGDDAIWFSDPQMAILSNRRKNVVVWSDTPADTGTVNDHRENPTPFPTTNNWVDSGRIRR